MRVNKKKRLRQKRTPGETERAYRRMIAERELQRRTAHWFALRFGWPMW